MTEVVAALIWENNKFLICQRPANKARGLLWEFVGGKVEVGETKQQALIRECQEELGVTLSVERELTDITYTYPDRIVHLYFYLCNIAAGVPEKKEHNALAWIAPDEVDRYEFCPADTKMLSSVDLKYI